MRLIAERNTERNRYRFVVLAAVEGQELRLAESKWSFSARGQALKSGRTWMESLTDDSIQLLCGVSNKQVVNL
jgi:hypothetical protein